ncbi:T9SS type A sorting domain-containing protein [Thalassobellus suaedae]|uniref:T9SS type A sorting domain-containing protein n=1 Tax=Thalassobellus suaedae TaxID=3074124 RepID=A0ABY9Y173_9FLAO|nr:T9SS type A sorting domain-containing protein [Flavobacteriaceae bacterium HL-DH10]
MMKKLLTLTLVFLFATFAMHGQIDIFDMEITTPATKPDVVLEPSGPGAATKPTVTSVPDPDGTRTGNSVEYVKTTGCGGWNALQAKYDGTTELGSYNLDTTRFFKFKVRSKDKTTFAIQIQIGSPDPGNFIINKTVTIPLDTWVEYEINLSGTPGSPVDSDVTINAPAAFNTFTRFRFDSTVAGAGETYYIDDVSASSSATLGAKDFKLTNVSVYPNPTTNKLTISTKEQFNFVRIYDIIGKTVKTFNNTKVLNISDLNTGLYFLKTDTGLQAKFVKN